MPTLLAGCRQPFCPGRAGPRGWCSDHDPGSWAGAAPMAPGWSARRAAVLDRDGHTCVLCRQPATEVDHIVPRWRGGSDEMANLRALCTPCHRARSARQGPQRGERR